MHKLIAHEYRQQCSEGQGWGRVWWRQSGGGEGEISVMESTPKIRYKVNFNYSVHSLTYMKMTSLNSIALNRYINCC